MTRSSAPDVALTGARIVTPSGILDAHALLIEDGRIASLVPDSSVPDGVLVQDLGGGYLLPGFIDTQVNGGGDVLFNDEPTQTGLRTIIAAHRRFGTTGLLPTLITDHLSVVDKALAAGESALDEGMPGLLGLHIEGPHLNPAKKGIHDASRIVPIDGGIVERLAAPTKGRRIVTLAPELAPVGAVRRLAEAGVLVCAGHSLATYEDARNALDEGLAGFTHLFNAMTQFLSREPGLVGAALESRTTHFGLIADGRHVHPASLRVARLARGDDGIMLVTDAMPPVGGTKGKFTLMGREIIMREGTCKGSDGTLAGSALTMAEALRNAMDFMGCDLVSASRMASGNPARFLRLDEEVGEIAPGLRADLVHLNDERHVQATWIAGTREDHCE
ncbi:MAG: N-acetylglucosamine-6-phosphate deacetylase [Pseudomonadota bacterium]|nr:N-acetylglucosamine-6-phosphate deacetylase [Pseudomonadota bacterium]